MIRLLLALAALSIAPTSAYADSQTTDKAPAAAAASSAATPPSIKQPSVADLRANYDAIHQHTLDNGLTVLIVEDHNVPIVTIEMAVRNGAFAESEDINGLSHLYEHMFFKANDVYPSQEAYMQRQQELGMDWNGTTSTERVNYFFTLPAELLDEGLAFMNAAIRTPHFKPDELEREKEVVLGEYDRAQANPYWDLWRGTAELLWYKHPWRKNPIGSREAIKNATVKHMEAMQQDFYVPNNSLLVLAGDIRKKEGIELAQKHFGSWEQGRDPFQKKPIPEHPPLQENAARSIGQPIGTTTIQMAWQGPTTQNHIEDTYAADILGYALSQVTSGLQKRLVDSGIALHASLGYHTQRHGGPIQFSVTVAPGNEQAAIHAMNAELARLLDADYLSDALIQTSKTVLSVDDLSLQQSSLQLAHTLSYWWCSADLDYYLNYIENLHSVTREDIQRFARRWIQNQPRAILLIGPENIAAEWPESRLLQAISTEVTP